MSSRAFTKTMEQEVERVERKQPRRSKSRKSLAESPLHANSSSSQNTRTSKSGEPSNQTFYEIEDIVAEEERGGKIWYKIDWKDDPRTGERYCESWEPKKHVTPAAIQAWERNNRKKGRREKENSEPADDSIGQTSTYEPEESQPIRPAKRKRASKAYLPESPGRAKKPRRAGTAETARFQSVSQEDLPPSSPYNLPSEIKDSYEDESSGGYRRKSVLQIILKPPKNFNRNEYHPVASSEHSHPSLSTEKSDPTFSQVQLPKSRRPFLWDEDIDESQVLPRSPSYEPPSSLVADADPITSTLFTSSRNDTGGTSSEDQVPGTSGYNPSTDSPTQQLLTTQSDSLENQYTVDSSSGKAIEEPDPLPFADSSGDRPSTSSAAVTWSEESYYDLPPEASFPDRQPDHPDFPSSFPFETQLPSLESDDFAGEEAPEEAPEEALYFETQNEPEVSLPASPLPEADIPQESRPESHQRQPISQELSSSLEHTWHSTSANSLPAHLIEESPADQLGTRIRSAHQSPFTSQAIHASQLLYSTISEHNLSTETPPETANPRPDVGEIRKNISPRLSEPIHSSERVPKVLQSPRTPERSPFWNSQMDSQSARATPTMDTKALMKQARANASARRAAEAASREASTVPPSPLIAGPSQMLPLRETVTEPTSAPPVVDLAPSPGSSPEPDSSNRSLELLRLEANEYIVPLSMVSHTRELYVNTVRNHHRQILEFSSDETPEPSLVNVIDLMIGELTKICNHQDLINDEYSTQRVDSYEIQAKWAEDVSTKCMFIAEFIDAIRFSARRIAILALPGRLQEILEALLKYHHFERRSGNSDVFHDVSGGPLTIALRSTTEEYLDAQPTDAIIAFDSPAVGRPYSQSAGVLISLVVTHSIEHLYLCFEQNSTIERRQELAECLLQMQNEVGKLSDEYQSPPEAAKTVAEFLNYRSTAEGSWRPWPLDPLPSITVLEVTPPPQTQSRSEPISGSATQSYDMTSQAPPSVKRQLGLDDSIASESPKRQRLSPLPTSLADSGMNRDISQVSDPVLQSSSDRMDSNLAEQVDPGSSSDHILQNSALLQKVTELEQQLHRKIAAEDELRERNRKLDARCKDYELGQKELNDKYQDALNDRAAFEHEINEALKRESVLKRKHENNLAELAKVKAEKDTDEAELIAARAQLASSAVPGVAEIEQAKEEVRAIKAENELLQRRHTSSQNDLDYLRDQYRTSSSAFSEAQRTITTLKEELATAKIKASENSVRINQIYNSSEVQQHLDRIRELKADNDALELDLEKKTDELKALTNGRRGTRGASVPRSPHMGNSAMSPGPQRAIGRVLGSSSRSRGNSPARGEGSARTPFGDALYQGPAGRFNHLQQ